MFYKNGDLNANTRKAIQKRIKNGELRNGGPVVIIGDYEYDIRDCGGQVKPFVYCITRMWNLGTVESFEEACDGN